MPDNITEELIAVLSSKACFEFKPLFDIVLLNLRERNAASGGEEMLRLRAYEKLQGLVSQGAVNRTVTGVTKKYKGVGPRMVVLRAEMKALRAACDQRARAKAAAADWSLTSDIGFRGRNASPIRQSDGLVPVASSDFDVLAEDSRATLVSCIVTGLWCIIDPTYKIA